MLGQSVCDGCGFDAIWCARESLFTNVTLWPTAIVTLFGLTVPPAEIVMVAPLAPGPVDDPPPLPDGEVGELLPHPSISTANAAAAAICPLAFPDISSTSSVP
jgi:hypothetical protein